MKQIFLILCLFFSIQLFGQSSDFILFKNKSKTIATWFPETYVKFTDKSGAYVEGRIMSIKNDSLFIKEYLHRFVQKIKE